jgi:hypothetical protein
MAPRPLGPLSISITGPTRANLDALRNDVISGPLGRFFGPAIIDIDLKQRRDGRQSWPFTHTRLGSRRGVAHRGLPRGDHLLDRRSDASCAQLHVRCRYSFILRPEDVITIIVIRLRSRLGASLA